MLKNLEFTQSDINKDFVEYYQTLPVNNAEVADDGRLLDYFIVDVTNGIMTLNNITVTVDVIPKAIPLK